MRKGMIYLAILASAVLAVPAAHARPVVVDAPVVVPGVQLVQYYGYGGRRDGEWRRHAAWVRWHRHAEWRHHHEYRHW